MVRVLFGRWLDVEVVGFFRFGPPVACFIGLYVRFEDGGLISRQWAVGGSGGEWVAGGGLDLFKRFLRTGESDRIWWSFHPLCAFLFLFRLSFQMVSLCCVWWSFISSLLLRFPFRRQLLHFPACFYLGAPA